MLGVVMAFILLSVLVIVIGMFVQLLEEWMDGLLSILDHFLTIGLGILSLSLILEIVYVLSLTL